MPGQMPARAKADLRSKFQRAVAKHRRAPTAATWFALGAILAEAGAGADKLRDLYDVDAVGCWRKCVKLAPKHADAWHALGRAYFEADDRAAATRALTRAVKLDPHVAQAWNQLAILTLLAPGEDLARVKRAEKLLRRAIEEDPRGKALGWEPYAWLAEAAERRRDDPGALAWYAEANKRGDKYAAARRQVIEGHGARRRAVTTRKRATAAR